MNTYIHTYICIHRDAVARARCLSACHELHGGGFAALRSNMPMNTYVVARAAGAQVFVCITLKRTSINCNTL